jgi:uncharacterized protein YbcC (UPF0753/DUF2309 family)
VLETRLTPCANRVHDPILESVLERIPPLWSLSDYVAVNPFLGYTERPITEAAREISDALGASVLPPVTFFRTRWKAGEFDPFHVTRAAARLGADANQSLRMLDPSMPPSVRPASQIATFAERYDETHGTQWELFVRTSIARYCAVFADAGGGSWHLDFEGGLWSTWQEAAAVDRAPDLTGLAGYRDHVASLPASARKTIDAILEQTTIPLDDLETYLYRLMGGLFGWASYFRRDSWRRHGATQGPLFDLLAIRLAADSFFAGAVGTPVVASRSHVEDESARLVLQEALEDAYVQSIAGGLARETASVSCDRDSVQAVFCIDVRSEVLRRHLESLAPSIRTLGFAGFFGVSLAVNGESARCPVLLDPSLGVNVDAAEAAWKLSLKKFQGMPPSAFAFVEVAGLAYAAKMLKDTCVGDRTADPEAHAAFDTPGLDHASRVATAAGILKNMSIGKDLARIVLLCGHHGRSANNPHAAGLDCGACGGHGGAINARVAVAILNDPNVRAALSERGTHVPEDTLFVAGVHDTSTDIVSILDNDRIPASHAADVTQLQSWLKAAGEKARAERAASLAIPAAEPHWLMRLLDRRARHWAEVRPEWALARNAAFIAARRHRTRGLDLAGRAFLHEYDAAADADASVLTLILTAPMVVASWINLQYFASTVDNDIFGSGTKTIHNRVGRLGVVLGNGGDLRTGLAIQSVHAAGGGWFHEPLRLQVIVEAPREKIDAVLDQHSAVLALVKNGWVRLFSLDGETPTLWLKRGDGPWEAVETGGLA